MNLSAVRWRPAATAAALLLACGLGVIPTDARAEKTYDACIEGSETTRDFAACGGALLEREEARLNRVWKEVYGKLSPATKTGLLKEQRTWIVYKDASCLYFTDMAEFGSQGASISYPNCRAAVISDRIKALEALAAEGP